MMLSESQNFEWKSLDVSLLGSFAWRKAYSIRLNASAGTTAQSGFQSFASEKNAQLSHLFTFRKAVFWPFLAFLGLSSQGTTIFTQVPPTRPLDLGLRMNEASAVLVRQRCRDLKSIIFPLFQFVFQRP